MIAAECNQGGDMVGTMLRESCPPCPVKLVRAKESKRARAQPVFRFYQTGRVWHAGPYPELEAQLVALGQGEGGDFDRADALVWAGHRIAGGGRACLARDRVTDVGGELLV